MHAYACVHLNIYMYTVICTKKKEMLLYHWTRWLRNQIDC
jgi:hypothetical protein